jgi:hypothetical protein
MRIAVRWPGPAKTAAGWTNISETPGTGGTAVYCDASRADDTGNGLTSGTAKKTLAAAVTVINTLGNNLPHRLLLKRGETWTNESIGQINKAGLSADEPLAIMPYGTGARPLIKSARNASNITFAGGDGGASGGDYTAVIGLELKSYTRDPADPGFVDAGTNDVFGISHFNVTNWFLVEDCKIHFYSAGNIAVSGTSPAYKKQVFLRRNIIADAYKLSGGAHAQGVYCDATGVLVLEENVIDHNGWHATEDDPDIFKQNVYAKATYTYAKNNIIARASANGIQFRGVEGTAINNFYVQNPIAQLIAHDTTVTRNSRMYDCVILEATDLLATPHGYGINVNPGNATDIRRNIVANHTSAAGFGCKFNDSGGYEVTNSNCSDNIFYNIPAGFVDEGTGNTGAANDVNKVDLNGNNVDDLSAAALNFPDPGRTLGGYAGTIGLTATTDAFLTAVKARAGGTWNEAHTANAVNNYIRAGYGMAVLP